MTSSKQPGGRKTPCDGKGECSLCNRYDCYYWQGAGCCPACGMPEGSCNCGEESDEGGEIKWKNVKRVSQ